MGCAVTRDQSTIGEYVDDSTVTTRVKAKFAEDPTVSAMSISVETLKGTVQLSGFAKSKAERTRAEALARDPGGQAGQRTTSSFVRNMPAMEIGGKAQPFLPLG